MLNQKKKIIVVSAINLFSGGTLTILFQCVSSLIRFYSDEYTIIVLVHDKKLLSAYDTSKIKLIEFKKSRKSWLYRLYYEYIYFWFYSKSIKPYLWFSLQDISPNVVAQKKVVYCHNPAPFYSSRLTLKEAKMSLVFALQNKFYSLLYQVNIRKNSFVIVQQEWLRKIFMEKYSVKRVIVAHPDINFYSNSAEKSTSSSEMKSEKVKFLYPSLPRVFKNFEIIGDAVRILEDKNIKNFTVCLTIQGDENAYSRYIYNRYKDLDQIKFSGLQSKVQMKELYEDSDVIIFPSKLETWGLPISEAKSFNKPILLIDLPYARETLGSYNKTRFFSPGDSKKLAKLMELAIEKELAYESTNLEKPSYPWTNSWKDLFETLLR